MIDACARSLNCLTTSYDVDDFYWLKFIYMAVHVPYG